ncbi:hypothetical protein HGRIS_012242 [Hohenbuehelia grisea]|uniref:Uncharacterized protein n=1 Tax=Hohenbuehelia grisea TaxID=104357 RepID=A0ABR3IRN3_9AGAR
MSGLAKGQADISSLSNRLRDAIQRIILLEIAVAAVADQHEDHKLIIAEIHNTVSTLAQDLVAVRGSQLDSLTDDAGYELLDRSTRTLREELGGSASPWVNSETAAETRFTDCSLDVAASIEVSDDARLSITSRADSSMLFEPTEEESESEVYTGNSDASSITERKGDSNSVVASLAHKSCFLWRHLEYFCRNSPHYGCLEISA